MLSDIILRKQIPLPQLRDRDDSRISFFNRLLM